jgi:DNA-binding MarR family transcriptional regulator
MTHESSPATSVAAPNEAADLLVSIGRLTRLLRRFGDLGALGPGAVAVLATLARFGPMRLADLAAAEQVTPPTMSRIVSALVNEGYVERAAHPDDGRAHLLSATAAGRQLVDGLTSVRARRLEFALQQLDDRERAVLGSALAKLVAALGEQACG